jgi:hypothetical protein
MAAQGAVGSLNYCLVRRFPNNEKTIFPPFFIQFVTGRSL